ncbi:MAG: hypothetical protein ABL949_14080 [Fimbriimonadaceae bacterium]
MKKPDFSRCFIAIELTPVVFAIGYVVRHSVKNKAIQLNVFCETTAHVPHKNYLRQLTHLDVKAGFLLADDGFRTGAWTVIDQLGEDEVPVPWKALPVFGSVSDDGSYARRITYDETS